MFYLINLIMSCTANKENLDQQLEANQWGYQGASNDHTVAQKIFTLETKYSKKLPKLQVLGVKGKKFLITTTLGWQVHFDATSNKMRISCTAVAVSLEPQFSGTLCNRPSAPS